MRDMHCQVERRLPIRRVEGTVLRGMLVHVHRDVEGSVDLLHGTAHRHDQAVGRCSGDRQSIGLSKRDYCLEVFDRRTELIRELRHAEEVPVIGTGWVVKPAQETCQCGLVSQRQHDGEIQALVVRERSNQRGLSPRYFGAHMIMQHLKRLLCLRHIPCGDQQRD